MTCKIVYLPLSTQIKKAASEAVHMLNGKLAAPDDTIGATEIMPLAEAILDLTELSTKVEAAIFLFNHRIEAYEAALSSGVAKPSSDFATNLDHRLTATADLLRATLDRLDQVEAAVMRLYKAPFLAIDSNDKPRKELASLRASFEVACTKPKQ
jgi:hypothetical protein